MIRAIQTGLITALTNLQREPLKSESVPVNLRFGFIKTASILEHERQIVHNIVNGRIRAAFPLLKNLFQVDRMPYHLVIIWIERFRRQLQKHLGQLPPIVVFIVSDGVVQESNVFGHVQVVGVLVFLQTFPPSEGKVAPVLQFSEFVVQDLKRGKKASAFRLEIKQFAKENKKKTLNRKKNVKDLKKQKSVKITDEGANEIDFAI